MDTIRAGGREARRRSSRRCRRRYWEPINRVYGLDIAIVNDAVDPTFSFMTVDHDGKIRMDCSSPYAMARLVGTRIAIASRSATIPTPTGTAS
jgi:phosphoglucomutase